MSVSLFHGFLMLFSQDLVQFHFRFQLGFELVLDAAKRVHVVQHLPVVSFQLVNPFLQLSDVLIQNSQFVSLLRDLLALQKGFVLQLEVSQLQLIKVSFQLFVYLLDVFDFGFLKLTDLLQLLILNHLLVIVVLLVLELLLEEQGGGFPVLDLLLQLDNNLFQVLFGLDH